MQLYLYFFADTADYSVIFRYICIFFADIADYRFYSNKSASVA